MNELSMALEARRNLALNSHRNLAGDVRVCFFKFFFPTITSSTNRLGVFLAAGFTEDS